MNPGKKPTGYRMVITGATIMFLAGVHTACNTRGEINSAQISTATGSSGSVAHKTWTQYGGGADQSK
ncbi:MAG TPA: hypothetical protein VK616_14395, partial [Flavitalea sp.]|nr:hypothetical protein [Flavitalea sp.]